MGQSSDKAGTVTTPDAGATEAAGGLREAAVAIDPPPRGALGIRELLALLEKEVDRDFPAGRADRPAGEPPGRKPARRQA